jgi:glycosyltransferase involved in cell wall biosynthesis
VAKILLHGNAPFVPSGYGGQFALLAPRLASLGHEVAISAFCGISGTAVQWEGIPVYPGGMNPYGADVIAGHARDFGADLVITLMDIWGLGQQGWDALASLNAASWMPIDCDPLSVLDTEALAASKVRPIAMSQFGRQLLGLGGFDPLYVPHGIDTSVFCPQDKGECRDLLNVPREAFVVGINAANADVRKAFPEQFAAFAILHNRHPDSILLVHTFPHGPGMDLGRLAMRLGIQHAIRFSDAHKYATGGYTAADLAAWYSTLDVYSGATRAEGFGLPVLEAQACFPAETPVTASGVLRGMERKYTGELISITTARGDIITATAEHPFWTARGWIPAGQLRYDDQLLYTGAHAESGILRVHSGRIGDIVATVRADAYAGCGGAYGQDLWRSQVAGSSPRTPQVAFADLGAASNPGYPGAVGLSGGHDRRRRQRNHTQGRQEAEAVRRGHQHGMAAHGVARQRLHGSVDLHGYTPSRYQGARSLPHVLYPGIRPSVGVRDPAPTAGTQAGTNGLRDRIHQGALGAGQAHAADGAPVVTDHYGARPQYQAVKALERHPVRDFPVYNLTTASSTYAAAGYLVHNCGVPVVVTDCSALSELCGAGWAVDAEPDWNDGHCAWWAKPHVEEIANAYESAYGLVGDLPEKAREFALGYSADALLPSWKKILSALV